MEPELLSHRNCLACLKPLLFGMLKQGKIIFVLSLKQHCALKNCLQG